MRDLRGEMRAVLAELDRMGIPDEDDSGQPLTPAFRVALLASGEFGRHPASSRKDTPT